jgi:hypothetical protein
MASSITTTSTKGWNHLPRELQNIVFEHCTWYSPSEAEPYAAVNQLAPLTTVSRDWQDFFEGQLFQRLTLKTAVDIETFAKLVQGIRRTYVKWIWLRIELPMYDCQQCHRLETREDILVQEDLFTNLVWNLFDALSDWKSNEACQEGITLELSAHSPSDAHHFNKDLRFRINDTAWDRWDGRPVEPHNDPFHGWRDGKKVKKIPTEAKYRVFGFGLRFNYNLTCVRRLRMRLPRVSVISSLVIRRQFPRAIAAIRSLNTIILSLPRLSSFCYEPWRGPTAKYQKHQDRQHTFLATEALKARRKSLKKVSIFESHDESFYRTPNNATRQRLGTGYFSCALARTSHHLEELYVANNAEAYEFLYAFQPQAPPSQRRWMAWKNLRKISLTTRLLAPRHDDLIILMAAEAAMAMPNLQIMELWNCWISRGIAAIFRFQRGETEASIEFVSTWPEGLSLSAASKEAWGRVATAQRPLPLRWKHSTWAVGEINGEHSVLSKLKLVEHLLNPVSLRQIAREDQRRREERDA